MDSNRKVKILEQINESLEKEIDNLKAENEDLKAQLYKEQNIAKEGYERTRELQTALEQAIAEYNDLTRECRTLRDEYGSNLSKMKKLRKQFRWKVIKAKV